MFNSLQQIIAGGRDTTTDELNLPGNEGAAAELQARLCDLGILDPIIDGDASTPFKPVGKGDGKIGLNTRGAIFEFCRLANIQYVDRLLNIALLKALVNARPEVLTPVQFDARPGDTPSVVLAKRLLRYMRMQGYWIARSPNMYNIVYVEGMNEDGHLNDDRFNEWNDRRIVIRIGVAGAPEMVVNDQATTEPGLFYTKNPLNPQGAARIAFGQYKAWVDGLHQGWQPALVQRENLKVHRDLNQDGKRSANDPIDIGKTFGINQHSTSPNKTPDLVGPYSAGCLVGRRYSWHQAFLRTVKKDVRYIMNKGYLFMSAIIAGDAFVSWVQKDEKMRPPG
ncbi:MAG: hypothetical protein U0U46_15515 [Saprospiraceae bacterium]|nr:hypothetical protein [Saprospiraceae bacterium]HNL37707.1 hypothetical protein [Saprospiraceae bacterium]